MTTQTDSKKILGRFLGDEKFPINWEHESDKERFWWFDDLHVPRPISPLFFDLGGWWKDCDYMFRRFGVPFGKAWHARVVNGYLYTSVERRDLEEEKKMAPYFEMVLPVYAEKFVEWWDERYLPEIKRNLDYLDNFPYEESNLTEMMILFEDAIDIQERHFRIHWILNLAQFAAFDRFGKVVAEIAGEEGSKYVGDILVSIDDKNWESSKALWEIKEKIVQDDNLKSIFTTLDNIESIKTELKKTNKGDEVLQNIEAYQKEYGYKGIYTHEYIYKLWVEDPEPIYETLRNYIDSDYNFNEDQNKVVEAQKKAIENIRSLINDAEDLEKFEQALNLALKMAPLTPDHHFYIDQGTYARLRIVIKELGKKFVERGDLDNEEDIFYLLYDEIREMAAIPGSFNAKERVRERRKEQEEAQSITPRDWIGTADYWSVHEQAYAAVWGYPERFELSKTKDTEKMEIRGLGASSGVVEGIARFINDPSEFDQLQQGEILVCRMTNPAWTLLFNKVSGLVTDAGGALSHPAVIAREYGIPAVTSTLDATSKIKTGQRIRVDGSTGVVTILD